MSEIHKGDPYAAWAGAEKRLSNAMDTIHELRAALAAKDAELAALRQERDELRAVVEAARYVVSETHGVNDDSVPDTFKAHLTVGDIRYLAAALARVDGEK